MDNLNSNTRIYNKGKEGDYLLFQRAKAPRKQLVSFNSFSSKINTALDMLNSGISNIKSADKAYKKRAQSALMWRRAGWLGLIPIGKGILVDAYKAAKTGKGTYTEAETQALINKMKEAANSIVNSPIPITFKADAIKYVNSKTNDILKWARIDEQGSASTGGDNLTTGNGSNTGSGSGDSYGSQDGGTSYDDASGKNKNRMLFIALGVILLVATIIIIKRRKK